LYDNASKTTSKLEAYNRSLVARAVPIATRPRESESSPHSSSLIMILAVKWKESWWMTGMWARDHWRLRGLFGRDARRDESCAVAESEGFRQG